MSLDRFGGRRNLVLVLLGAGAPGDAISRLLQQLGQSRTSLADEEAEVLVVAAANAGEMGSAATSPFVMLVDRDEAFHRRLNAVDAAGRIAPAVVITDRYREIYHIFRPTEPAWPPTAEEVVSWLVFMNIQCPECGAPEW